MNDAYYDVVHTTEWNASRWISYHDVNKERCRAQATGVLEDTTNTEFRIRGRRVVRETKREANDRGATKREPGKEKGKRNSDNFRRLIRTEFFVLCAPSLRTLFSKLARHLSPDDEILLSKKYVHSGFEDECSCTVT